MLFINRKLYILDTSDVRAKVLRTMYETPLVSYIGYTSIYIRTSSYYFWLKIIDLVSRYVKSYYVYKRLKSY